MNDEDRYMSSQQVADFVANNLGLPELAEKLRGKFLGFVLFHSSHYNNKRESALLSAYRF